MTSSGAEPLSVIQIPALPGFQVLQLQPQGPHSGQPALPTQPDVPAAPAQPNVADNRSSEVLLDDSLAAGPEGRSAAAVYLSSGQQTAALVNGSQADLPAGTQLWIRVVDMFPLPSLALITVFHAGHWCPGRFYCTLHSPAWRTSDTPSVRISGNDRCQDGCSQSVARVLKL